MNNLNLSYSKAIVVDGVVYVEQQMQQNAGQQTIMQQPLAQVIMPPPIPTQKASLASRIKDSLADILELLKSLTSEVHYMELENPNGTSRTILTKSGAELIAKTEGWRAEFFDTKLMKIGDVNQLSIKVRLLDENNKEVGQGVGARNTSLDGDEYNTSYKMAAKSAFVDAVLRVTGLSTHFSQDEIPNDKPKNTAELYSERAQTQAVATPQAATPSLSVHKKKLSKDDAIIELCRLAGSNKYLTDIRLQFGCNSLSEMSYEQLIEAQELVKSSQNFKEKELSAEKDLVAKHDQHETDFILTEA